ncbi:Rhamnan synthesis protein F OS=Afipia felis OX=1035 GN=NCTC12722_01217 PE=4 SV=1 [Afipia felis]
MQDDEAVIELNGKGAVVWCLHAKCRSTMPPFIRVWKNNSNSLPVFIPATSSAEFLVRFKSPGMRLFCSREEVDLTGWRPWQLLDYPKLARLLRFHRFTLYEDNELSIQPLLRTSDSGLDVARAMRTLAEWGVGVSTATLQETLRYEFAPPPMLQNAPALTRPVSIAVVVHLHYDEVWRDFSSRLSRLSLPFELIVTTSETRPERDACIRADFPEAKIIVYENRGRDVGPFMQLLHDGYLEKHELICKVHSKRSLALGSRAIFGEVWRLSMLNDLLGSDAAVKAIINRFLAEPDLGLVGPARFRLPNDYRHSYEDTWGRNNEAATKMLATTLGCSGEGLQLDFFAGTMFWIRKELFNRLKPLALTLESFPEEAGQPDGTLQHALERIFGALPSLAVPPMKTEGVSWRRPAW